MIRRRMLLISEDKELGTPQNSVGLFHFESKLTNSSTASSGKLSMGYYYVGTSTYSSTFKFGQKSFDLNSFDGWIVTSALATVLNSSEFTIDYWVKVNDTSSTTEIDLNTFSFLTSSQRSRCRLGAAHYITSGQGYIRVCIASTSTWQTNIPVAVSYNSGFNHIAFVRKDNVVKVYVNGQFVVQYSFTYTNNTLMTGPSYLGSCSDITTGENGYCSNLIDELRISNVARWTKNFTPPTAAYV